MPRNKKSRQAQRSANKLDHENSSPPQEEEEGQEQRQPSGEENEQPVVIKTQQEQGESEKVVRVEEEREGKEQSEQANSQAEHEKEVIINAHGEEEGEEEEEKTKETKSEKIKEEDIQEKEKLEGNGENNEGEQEHEEEEHNEDEHEGDEKEGGNINDDSPAPSHAHPLKKIPSHTDEGDIYCCDECMGSTPIMWHCETCGYDVCLTCASSGEIANDSIALDFAAAGRYHAEHDDREAGEGDVDEEEEIDPHKELEDLYLSLGGVEGDKKPAPFGSWETPFTSEWIVKDVCRFMTLVVDNENLYWTESRPQEKGRAVVVKCAFSSDGKNNTNNSREDITPPNFSARSRVHEYGGGEFTVSNGRVLFVNMADQKLYSQIDSQPPVLVVDARVADMDRIWGNYVYAVYEDHSKKPEPENSIIRIDLTTGLFITIARGHDFYSSPRVNHSGTKLAFIAWDHPSMPWDTTALYLCDLLTENFPCEKIQGEKDESVMEPRWSKNTNSKNDILYFMSDKTNYWNLYKYQETFGVKLILKKDVEFGGPAWIFGASTYCVLEGVEDTLAVTFFDKTLQLNLLHAVSGELYPLSIPDDITTIEDLTSFSTSTGVKLAYVSGSSSRYDRIEVYDLKRAVSTVIHTASPTNMANLVDFCSAPTHISFPTTFNRDAHGVFYRPCNKNFWGLPNTLPPLLVKIHGGPTSNTTIKFRPDLQYWTSRGWAVLDVDYGGSAGYGREYRNRLNGQWGVVDVDDCCAGAQFLVNQGLVDENRLAITGGSAGGYTVFATLAFRNTFSAGGSHFGVSDLAALATDTHKFESRYLDTLVGPYPERKDIYIERSPIFHVDKISRPLVLFQGLDDKVVPPNQSRLMYEAVKSKGLPVALIEFEGEGHGFRQGENIRRSLDGEYYFYSRVFQFPPSPDIAAPIVIENLDTPQVPVSPAVPIFSELKAELATRAPVVAPPNAGSLYPSLDSPARVSSTPVFSVTSKPVSTSPANSSGRVSAAAWGTILVAVLGAVGFVLFRKRK